tara:strand:+ start:1057 stop:1239 length:183 start_codon:yes stop_codon:yes gene_type:complete
MNALTLSDIDGQTIITLSAEAAQAGDRATVILCERALCGSHAAKVEVLACINDARAMDDE